jgi:GT2 family glycosyltransferase
LIKGSRADLTVIIPNWNQRKLLKHCLDSIEKQTLPCRVIVVDNGSADRSNEMVKEMFPECVCIPLPKNQGFAKAVNIGIQSCETPYIALLNNDTEADPSWVEKGLYALESFPEYSFFASRIIDFFDRTRLDSAGDTYDRYGLPTKRGFGESCDAYLDREPVAGASAGAAFYRKEIFETAGLLDESYYLYLEDVELSLRAQVHGYRCLYLPDAVVYHIEGASDPDRKVSPDDRRTGIYSAKRVFWITRNRWQLMLTYQPVRNTPWLLYGWIKSFAFHMIKAGYLLPFLKGLAAGIGRSSYALHRRKDLTKTGAITNWELWQKRVGS